MIEHSFQRSPVEKLSIEQFEVIAQAAAREDVTLEYLNGQMEIRTVPDSDHNAILMWLMRQFMTQRAGPGPQRHGPRTRGGRAPQGPCTPGRLARS